MAELLTGCSVGVNGTRVVLVGGELDMATAPEVETLLAGLDGHDLIVDLWDLSFIDSSGFRVLVDAHQRLDARGKRLTIRGINSTALRSIEVPGLDGVLHLDGGSRV